MMRSWVLDELRLSPAAAVTLENSLAQVLASDGLAGAGRVISVGHRSGEDGGEGDGHDDLEEWSEDGTLLAAGGGGEEGGLPAVPADPLLCVQEVGLGPLDHGLVHVEPPNGQAEAAACSGGRPLF